MSALTIRNYWFQTFFLLNLITSLILEAALALHCGCFPPVCGVVVGETLSRGPAVYNIWIDVLASFSAFSAHFWIQLPRVANLSQVELALEA